MVTDTYTCSGACWGAGIAADCDLTDMNVGGLERPLTAFYHSCRVVVGLDRSTAELGESELDLYLGFCERALLGETEERLAGEREGSGVYRHAVVEKHSMMTCCFPFAERRILDEYFPLNTEGQDRREGDRRRAQEQELVVGRRRAMTMTVGGHEEKKNEGRKPGEGYTVYNTQDVLGTVPEGYALVVGRAARWTGVDSEYIYGVVERYERRLVRWWDGMRRRRSREGEGERRERET